MRRHIALVGTGLTTLTTAHCLLTHRPALSFSLTIIDKARAPGGRLTSRTYPPGPKRQDAVRDDDSDTLETGARVFQSTEDGFHTELESFARRGLVREVAASTLRGVSEEVGFDKGTRWWESVGGVSKGLIAGLVEEINHEVEANEGVDLKWHFNTAVQPAEDIRSALTLRTEPGIESLTGSAVDILVHTAPSPQIHALLPSLLNPTGSTVEYLQTFCLLLPTLRVPSDLPVYHRNPSSLLTAIATGFSSAGGGAGIVVQATPQQLDLVYEREKTSDADIRQAFVRVLREDGHRVGLTSEVIAEVEVLVDSQEATKKAQVKRWKYAQVVAPPVSQDAGEINGSDAAQAKQFSHIPIERRDQEADENGDGNGHLIIAGDGQSRKGGVEGAWESGREVADWVIGYLEKEQKRKV